MEALLSLRPLTVYALRLGLLSMDKRRALDKRRGEMLRAIAMGLGYEVPSYACAVDALYDRKPADARCGADILKGIARDMDEMMQREEGTHGE